MYLIIGYGLRTETYERVPWLAKDEQCLDWTTLPQSCLLKGTPTCMIGRPS